MKNVPFLPNSIVYIKVMITPLLLPIYAHIATSISSKREHYKKISTQYIKILI